MNQEQVLTVRKTWRLLRDINPSIIGDTFYSKLFSLNKQLRKYYPERMDSQYTQFFDMLGNVVMQLGQHSSSNEISKEMTTHHFPVKAKALHYKLAGEALLWTLAWGLGEDWDVKTEEAWRACYEDFVRQSAL